MQKKLAEFAVAALPREAGGVIANETQVIEVPNHADTPENSFELRKPDIAKALGHLADIESLAIWHSHPGGGVGPSKIDLHNRVMGVPHLVVTLVHDEFVFTWY